MIDLVSVHVYLPVSEVVSGEKVRVSPSVEIRPSREASTAEPFTIQLTVVFTDRLRLRV